MICVFCVVYVRDVALCSFMLLLCSLMVFVSVCVGARGCALVLFTMKKECYCVNAVLFGFHVLCFYVFRVLLCCPR